jgi:hypothetical protein
LILAGGLALAVALAACVRRENAELAVKGASLGAVCVIGFLVLGLVGVYQYATIGQVSYYFDKLAIGTGLISVPVLVASLGLHVEPPRPSWSRLRTCLAVVASVLAALAALQVFTPSGLGYRAAAMERIGVSSPSGLRLLRAAELSESRPFGSTVYLAALPGDAGDLPVSQGALIGYYWQVALSGMWTSDSRDVTDILIRLPASDILTADMAADTTQKLLEASPRRTIIVAPEIVEPIRAALPVGLRGRVITWGLRSD